MSKSKILSVLNSLGYKNNKILFVGCYTDESNSTGIHILTFNNHSGELTHLSEIKNVANASYLIWSKDQNYLYAVNENGNEVDQVSAFKFDKETNQLTLINKQPSYGSAPCYLALDHSNRYLTVANYLSGNIAIYPIEQDGTIGEVCQQRNLPHINKDPHAHHAIFTPDNDFLLITDLGNDRIYQYSFDADSPEPLGEEFDEYILPVGHGPRHLVFSKDENFVYLINEWEAIVSVYHFENDALVHKQDVVSSGIEPPEDNNKGSAAIKISHDGQYLYTSNRGNSDSISAFKIGADGLLTKIAEQPSDAHPRDFILDHTGKWLLVASRDDNSIRVYEISDDNGLLKDSGHHLKIDKPVTLLEY